MNKFENINIAVIEPSQIVYEGLTYILTKIKLQYQLFHFDDLDEFLASTTKDRIKIAIVNPLFVQHAHKNFANIKRNNPHVKWLGLIYCFFDKETLRLFDATIQITDSPGTIDFSIDQLLKIETDFKEEEATQGEQLTEREIDVLLLLVHGLSNKEIADKLNISTHTVVSHRKNIIQKTGIKSQSGLTIYAISNKLVSLDDF